MALRYDVLTALLPSLNHTLSTLHSLLTTPHPPPFIFLHAPTNTHLVSQILRSILSGASFTVLDLVELWHPKLVYDALLHSKTETMSIERSDERIEVESISQLGAELARQQVEGGDSGVRFWIWERGERMQGVGKEGEGQSAIGASAGGDGWMGGMLRLATKSVCSIVISHLSWAQIRVLSASGGVEPIVVDVENISGEDEISLLAHMKFEGEEDPAEEEEKNLYRSLLALLLNTFSGYIGNDLSELGWLGERYWDRWRGFVTSGIASADEEAKLMMHLKPELMDQITSFSHSFKRPLPLSNTSPTSTAIQALPTTMAQKPSLPKFLSAIAKYLLLAAYFASYNPTRSDRTLFVRVDESAEGGLKKKKRKRKAVRKAKDVDEMDEGLLKRRRKEPQHLLGPKAFAVSYLLSLRLLTPATSSSPPSTSNFHPLVDRLLETGFKLKCNVGLETVEEVGVSLGWKVGEVRERIWGMNEDNVL
ncbi:hypothetical protein BT69DRAFT_1279467 [Atractiella rhizophila]|nr:hypothetical protein BT69DRAFT_1279467 [Atractiella rhizophila]